MEKVQTHQTQNQIDLLSFRTWKNSVDPRRRIAYRAMEHGACLFDALREARETINDMRQAISMEVL